MSTLKSQESPVLCARPYQIELLNKAIERNIVVCLGTGTGKTFISVLLIKELSYQVRRNLDSGGKRTFFLVNTVPLVDQQKKVIEQNTDLAVRGYVGEMGVDFWDDEKWQQELKKHQVLVMTAQIFVDLLGHGKVRLSRVNLIVFDECHHAKKEHPYTQVMKYFVGYERDELPRILGLTASIVNGKVKPTKIESEIRNLEKILRAVCETSNDDNVGVFATKPREIHVEIPDKPVNYLFKEVVEPWQDFLNDCASNSEALKVAKSIVKDCVHTMTTLGASAACRVTQYFLTNLVTDDVGRSHSRDDDHFSQLLVEYTATQLRQLQKVYTETVDDEIDPLSSKVKRLVEKLKEYKKLQEDPQTALCGIVFVERRCTAAVLCEQLRLLSGKDEDLDFINCNYVVGHGTLGSVISSSSADMTWKQQEKVLREFRQHNINLLIATSVVEEGLDVPKCNLVVRFDFPKTYQSYVQSKGRARARDSKYVILISEEAEAEDLQMYHAIEDCLTRVCQDRSLPTEEESIDAVDTDRLPPYRTEEGATLRMSNSISTLDRYCSKLPGDKFTPLNAAYKIDEVGLEAFQATVKLPMNSPVKEKIKGDVMPRKQQAKMAAAYKSCIELHKLGELDNYLLPVEDLSDDDTDVAMETEQQGRPKRGTKRSKQSYPRKIPKVFQNSLPKPGKRYFLYVFTKKYRSNEESEILKYGIVMNSRLSEIRPFVLYPDKGKVVISISECCVNTPILSTTDISRVEKFNAQLMSEMLKISCERNPAKADGYYIVPLKTSSLNEVEIDFDELRISRYTTLDAPRRISSINALKNQESIINPQHRPRERFVVQKVCADLTPSSAFPDPSKARTYEEYFSTIYDLKTTKMKQPLILVKRFPERINFLTDRKKTKAETKASKEIHFIPEHCSLHPFPATSLLAAAEIPSILHRLTSILLVGEVRELVADGCDKQACHEATQEENLPPIEQIEQSKNKKKGKSQLQNLFSDLRTNAVQSADTYLLLQALTTKGAGDAFDLERLEMLGDAFLKQAVTICLFCCYPFKDEGKLTRRKVKQISNLNLYHVSIGKEFPTYMQNTVLDRKTWLLPCLELTQVGPTGSDTAQHLNKKRKHGEEDQERSAITEQVISDKSVADSIEALIGAYLVSCGYQAALHFLNFLGVKVFPDKMDQYTGISSSTKYSVFEIPKFLPLTDNASELEILTEELKGFESRIKYEFNDKLYLIQALTHASHQYNKVAADCYQRLEFLGDAVLDFVVTECLYSSNPTLSPGQLTDLRQALVNNNIFAKIAVEHGYHKYLKYTSPQWFKKINDFVLQLEDDQREGKPQVDDDPFIIMSDEDDEAIEAPKVLGDIFESVAGAVFLDSGMDVVKTWQVYYRMMKPYVDHYSKHVPCNPIRWVHEKDSEAQFSEAEKQRDKILCHLTVRWGVFTGKGANKKIAKVHAARLARDAFKPDIHTRN